ncbi:MAG: hypothetical protein AAF598_13405, partial [Bacteroidota bacterium]
MGHRTFKFLSSFHILLLAFSVVLLNACQKLDLEPVDFDPGISYPNLSPTSRGDLLFTELVKELNPEAVLNNLSEREDIADELPDLNFSDYLRYPISVYRVYYSSVLGTQDIVLSGLVMVPQLDEALPQYQF